VNYNRLDQGWNGPTSPAESGQQGAYANQGAVAPSNTKAAHEYFLPEKNPALVPLYPTPSKPGAMK
jgi:hypothetical protein